MASLCRLTYALRRHQSLFSPACFSILNSSPHFLAQNSAIPISSPPLQSCYSSFTPTRTNPPWKNTNLRGYSTAVAEKTPIKVGDRLPDATLPYFDKEGNLQKVSISALAAGKKIVLFAVPGAFTVNNAFAVKAWAESIGVDGNKVLVLSDKNRHFTNAMGVAVDLSDKPVGLGVRSRLFSLLAEDGIVKVLHVKEGGLKTISGADDILKVL